MKRLLLLVLFLTGIVSLSLAQGFILSGRLVDKKNKPVKNALIQAVGSEHMGFATTNDDGLYYTAEVPAGKYEVIIKIDSTPYLAKLNIAPTDSKKRFYNFKINGKSAELSVTDKDVFMDARLSRLRSDPSSRIDASPGKHIRIIPATSSDNVKKH